MVQVIRGERIGRQGKLMVGCVAVVFDEARERVLLTRRTDNGRWCLPGGQMEPGESAEECCLRELWEETGLRGRVLRLIGLYSDPDMLLAYPDGNRFHLVSLSFEVERLEGDLALSNETTAFGYFTPDEMAALDIMEHHRSRLADAFANQPAAFVR